MLDRHEQPSKVAVLLSVAGLLGWLEASGRLAVKFAQDKQQTHLYRLGTAQGNAHAQTNLGYLYQHGYVVPCNDYVAARQYRPATE